MIRDELRRLMCFEERHRRLLARLTLAAMLSLVVFVVGTLTIWASEGGRSGSGIGHGIDGLGDAAFFTGVQLLTVSSSLAAPVTVAGRIVDIGLEVWALVVVTTLAGSFASFFGTGDAAPPEV